MAEPARILPVFEPPPGGLERLRARIAERPRCLYRATPAIVGLIILALVTGASWLLVGTPGSATQLSGKTLDPRLVSLGLQKPPSQPAVVLPEHEHEMALLRVPLGSERVVFYRLITLSTPPAAEAPDG